MKLPIDYGGRWKTLRYEWKKRIGKSQCLSRNAKLLATMLCDTYANHKTACCWPSNRTLADLLCVHERSIQRWMCELKAGGWIRSVRLPRRRRGLQLLLPDGHERDTEHVTEVTPKVPPPSQEHDRWVAPYKEPYKNQKDSQEKSRPNGNLRYVIIGEDETVPLEHWKSWIKRNLDTDVGLVLSYVNAQNEYRLPSRYPADRDEDVVRYHLFFETVVGCRGKVFEG